MTDFCNIKAGKYDPQHIRKLSFQNTPHVMRGKSEFPDPKDYEKWALKADAALVTRPVGLGVKTAYVGPVDIQ